MVQVCMLFCFCEVIYTVLMLNIIRDLAFQCSYQNHDFFAKSFIYQVNDKTYNQKIRDAFTLLVGVLIYIRSKPDVQANDGHWPVTKFIAFHFPFPQSPFPLSFLPLFPNVFLLPYLHLCLLTTHFLPLLSGISHTPHHLLTFFLPSFPPFPPSPFLSFPNAFPIFLSLTLLIPHQLSITFTKTRD